jgi:NAD+ kinase
VFVVLGAIMIKVGLVVKNDREAEQKAQAFEQWLVKKRVTVVRQQRREPDQNYKGEKLLPAPPDLLCVFVLGGDGTFLGAIRWTGDQQVPVLGVKFGEVGFLAEAVEEDLFSRAESILNNDFTTSKRMRLLVRISREGREIARETVLNDVVINKGTLARLADIETRIDGHYLTTYRADGLIISTPTGSTAYSLAAGGPVLQPDVPGIIMTPICPFTLTNRPLIIPDLATISLYLVEKAADIMLTFDGQAGLELTGGDTIEIVKSKHPVQMINIPGQNYYDVLKAKLRWSGGRV